jgi:hypothetical protein
MQIADLRLAEEGLGSRHTSEIVVWDGKGECCRDDRGEIKDGRSAQFAEFARSGCQESQDYAD